MPRSNYQSKPIFNLGSPAKTALQAKNIRYFYAESGAVGVPQCKVRTRAGHATAFNPASAVKSMSNFVATDPFLSSNVNRVIFYDGSSIKNYDVPSAAINDFHPPITGISALKISVAQASTRAYIAAYDANGIGATQGRVVDTLGDADKLFQGPPPNTVLTLTPIELGVGSVTAGLHNIGLIMTTRTGYSTKPGPVDLVSAFIPVSITATGGKTIRVNVAGLPWPTSAASFALIMTPVDDPGTYYFAAGAGAAVPGGSNFTIQVEIDVSDAALLNSPPAAGYFDLLSQDGAGNGPFNPSFVCAYKNRMVYGAGDKVYISEPFNFQWITETDHVQFLPGLQHITGAFPYRDGNLYLVSTAGTFALSDNGDKPVNWSGPQLIDGKVGTPAPAGMTRDPAQSRQWMATAAGLRLFQDGIYQDPPISFWQPDWQEINWGAATTIEIMDDFDEQTVRVLVPLGAATSPSHEFTFNYKSGPAPEAIRFSRDTPTGRYCFALVQSNSTGRLEVWLGPAASGTVWRRDKTATLDIAAAITGQVYETGRLLDVEELGGPVSFHGAHYTARGTANLKLIGWAPYDNLSTRSSDGIKHTDDKTTDLSQIVNGKRVLRQWLMNAENQSLEFSADSGWFELTETEPYYTPWVRQR